MSKKISKVKNQQIPSAHNLDHYHFCETIKIHAYDFPVFSSIKCSKEVNTFTIYNSYYY